MAYQVLARKWRPRRFEDMVGQQHILRVIINALDTNRLHHAYLFTGTRGVGKTTIARIFAKSLNCERGVSSKPCGECAACKEVDSGRFVDLIEVDAASRTKVDDTRDLLENVQYAPTRGRYKVYLIDEVHMLSTSSFNALLKTLEEPPPHIKFLLATTDPQKLPVTVLSRCLQCNLKRMPPEMIAKHLHYVLQQESVEYQAGAVQLLAKAADGSMRDALSLLDQGIAFGGGKLSEEETASMLGAIERGAVADLLRLLAAGDAPGLLARVARLAEQNPDYGGLLAEMLSLLQRIAVAQSVPGALEDEEETARELSQKISPEDTQLFYQIALNGRRDLPYSPEPRGGFEMLLLRMLAFRPLELETQATHHPAPAARPAPPRPAMPSHPNAPPAAPVAEIHESAPPAAASGEWHEIVQSMRLLGMLGALANQCILKSWDGDTMLLILPSGHASLNSPKRLAELQRALSNYYGKPVKLKINEEALDKAAVQATPAARQQEEKRSRQQEAVEEMESDPLVQDLKKEFDAKLDKNSVKPVGNEPEV